jgi:hypothetical protein
MLIQKDSNSAEQKKINQPCDARVKKLVDKTKQHYFASEERWKKQKTKEKEMMLI